MVWLSASTLSAQYFGRSKVEYRDFDFRIFATEHFDVYYYPREERAARIAARRRALVHALRALLHTSSRRGSRSCLLQPPISRKPTCCRLLPDSVGASPTLPPRVTIRSRQRWPDHRVLGTRFVHAFHSTSRDALQRHRAAVFWLSKAWLIPARGSSTVILAGLRAAVLLVLPAHSERPSICRRISTATRLGLPYPLRP